MGRQAPTTGSYSQSTTYRSGLGPSMMGGSYGYPGGMMGGYGMMGTWNGTPSMQQYMRQYMSHYWNSTSAP